MLMPADPCTAWLDSLMWASQVLLMLVMAMAMVIIPIMMAIRMMIAAMMVIVSMILVQLGLSYTFSKLAIKFCL